MRRERFQNYTGNGDKARPTFSAEEMADRIARLREHMAAQGVDAVLFSSYHNIDYFSDFLYCQFGRRYALAVNNDSVTSVSAGIDGGQPWRRTVGDNLVYTDWNRENFVHAVSRLLGNATRVGIEFDHVSIDYLNILKGAFPGMDFVDIAVPAMHMRMIKSEEEIELIAQMARIADLGGAACVEAASVGAAEHEVALHSTSTMVREIARTWPHGELMNTWTWFQSGINTDGAHNPVTSRRIQSGDVLSLNCFPMVAGYYVALERTLFAEQIDDESLRLWQINCQVHERGLQLLVPGKRCSEIARELNAMYEAEGLLQYRSFGFGHSFGVLCHYYGREAALELREDCDTVLKPGMVVSMEPMITIPQHRAGAGGYREHDILLITDTGNRNLTAFPYGPEHLIIGRN